jgi:hypothetical protein
MKGMAIDIRILGRELRHAHAAALALARGALDIIRHLISFMSMSVPCGTGRLASPIENREHTIPQARLEQTERRHRALMLRHRSRADRAQARFTESNADMISRARSDQAEGSGRLFRQWPGS